jgi:type IV secretory pathway component VirB8
VQTHSAIKAKLAQKKKKKKRVKTADHFENERRPSRERNRQKAAVLLFLVGFFIAFIIGTISPLNSIMTVYRYICTLH